MGWVKKGLIILALMLILLQSTLAIGIVTEDSKVVEFFEPGKEIEFFIITIGVDPHAELEVFLDDNTGFFEAGGEFEYELVEDQYNFKLTCPESLPVPGDNSFNLHLKEVPDTGLEGSVYAMTEVIYKVILRVPYPYKYIEADFEADDVREGEYASFSIPVTNLGEEDLESVYSVIEIYEDGSVVELVDSQETYSIGSTESKTLHSEWLSDHPGIYEAKAVVYYDGDILELEDEFRVGSLDVNIINYTDTFLNSTIAPLSITVESNWNDEIEGVYAVLDVLDDDTVVKSVQTPSVDLNPWGVIDLESFLDTRGLGLGKYDAIITVYYEGLEKSEDINITIVDDLSKSPLMIPVAYVAAGLLVGGMILFGATIARRFRKKKKHSRYGKK